MLYFPLMIPDLQSVYRMSEEQTRLAFFGLGVLVVLAMLGIVFLSPTMVVGIVLALVTIFFAFAQPTWVLAGLMFYLPFEPFVLKWLPDELYIYVKYGSELLVYLLGAAVMWRIFTGNIRWKRTPIDGPFVFLLVMLAASVLVNFIGPFQAVLGIRQIIRFILLFFVTVALAPTRRWIRGVFLGLAAIIVFQCVLGYGQAVIGEPLDAFLLPSARRTLGEIQLTSGTVQFWDPGQRVFGTLGRYDQLGTFLAFFLIIAVALIYQRALPEKYGRWLGLGMLVALPVLAMTYSRSAWFGFLLGFLFIALLVKRDRRVLIASIVVPSLLTVYLAVSGLAVNRLIDSPSMSFAERFFEVFSVERFRGEYFGLGRVYWIVQTLTTVVPSAPLFGHGPATYGGGAVAALGATAVYDELGLPFGVYGTEGYIDNNWFSLWGESGTLGLAAYLWMYVMLFLTCVRVYRKSQDPETKALALGAAGAMLAVALNASLATFLEARTLAVYLWVTTGVVVSLGVRERVIAES